MRIIRIEGPGWFARAACRGQDPAVWVPDPEAKRSTQRQRTICAGCPVITECLAYATADESLVGIWGGTSEEQRDQLRRRSA